MELGTESAVQEEVAEDSTRDTAGRISREELLNEVTESAPTSKAYLVMTVRIVVDSHTLGVDQ